MSSWVTPKTNLCAMMIWLSIAAQELLKEKFTALPVVGSLKIIGRTMDEELKIIVDLIIHVADTYFTNPDATSRVHSAGMLVDALLIKEMKKRNENETWNTKYCIQ